MEDFTTFCKNMPKKQNNFSRSLPTFTSKKKTRWISKNRFWNLVFWFGMSAGFTASSFARFSLHNDTLASVIMWLTLLGMPLLTVLANRTRFIKEDTFVNSENIVLTEKQLPTGIFILFTIVAILITGYLSPKNPAKQVLTAFPFFLAFFSGFSLYFIFKNCPISILFNRKFWKFKPTTAHTRGLSDRNRSSSSPTPFNIMMNPIYKNHSSNIYHRNR